MKLSKQLRNLMFDTLADNVQQMIDEAVRKESAANVEHFKNKVVAALTETNENNETDADLEYRLADNLYDRARDLLANLGIGVGGDYFVMWPTLPRYKGMNAFFAGWTKAKGYTTDKPVMMPKTTSDPRKAKQLTTLEVERVLRKARDLDEAHAHGRAVKVEAYLS